MVKPRIPTAKATRWFKDKSRYDRDDYKAEVYDLKRIREFRDVAVTYDAEEKDWKSL